MDFVKRFEQMLRKKHHALKVQLDEIEGLLDAFEKGRKRGAKVGRGRLSAAVRKKISLAQKARWAKARKVKAAKG